MKEKKKLLLIIITILLLGTAIKAYKFYFVPINPNKVFVTDTRTTTHKKITFETPKIVVHIAGAVQNPGVYKVEKGQRTIDIINTIGGGLLPEADIDKVNLAQIPKDGKRINVPFLKIKKQKRTKLKSPPQQQTIININTASAKELENLNRVGPKTAQKIINYRTENGRFKSIEALKKVNGIGPKTIEINRHKIKI